MIDTVVLISPDISEDQAIKIEKQLEKRIGIDFESDKILYEITSKQLQGSFDNRIRITVKRQRFSTITIQGKNFTELHKCKPYIEIELSLHKFFLGHNILGGSDDLIYQTSKVIEWLNELFNVELPDHNIWEVQRIDYARAYKLQDMDNFFSGFSKAYYPRRRFMQFDVNSVYFPGSYTTLKLYSKEVEFKEHDRKKLRKVFDLGEMSALDALSKNVLRIEVEVRVKKLKDIYGVRPKVKDLKMEDIKEQFIVEVKRIFKIKDDNMKTYNKNTNVRERIYDIYDTQLANTLYGVWCDLSINGYKHVKDKTPKSTFYRYVNQLQKIGIVWNNTDLVVQEQKEYIFNPLDTDLEIKIDLIAA